MTITRRQFFGWGGLIVAKAWAAVVIAAVWEARRAYERAGGRP